MDALTITKVHKVYQNKTHALKGLTFTVKQGEFFALLGPNGSGKTTLISIMAGSVKKTDGSIKVCGLDINEYREETKMLLGIVPQEITFDSFFTVNETLQIQSGYYGLKNNQKYIDELLDRLNLRDKKYTNTRALSGGMKRRLLIAKALVHKPKVVVLDEPTAGVDIELRHSLWKYIRELNAEGTTILLTTHYLEEAESICERTAIISLGKLVALDKTKKLIRSMGDKKILTLSFEKEIKNIPDFLKKYLPERKTAYDIALTVGPVDITKILKEVESMNNKLIDLSLDGQDLEDVFLKLTNE